jgi:hypothetical protein
MEQVIGEMQRSLYWNQIIVVIWIGEETRRVKAENRPQLESGLIQL